MRMRILLIEQCSRKVSNKTLLILSLFSSPRFPKREKSGLLNNLQKLVQSIMITWPQNPKVSGISLPVFATCCIINLNERQRSLLTGFTTCDLRRSFKLKVLP